jgi:two-component system, chemotaxis family, sensor kinase CheA
VMDIRMLPCATVFGRFPRLVRDVAKRLDKRVRLALEGEETAADKDVLDLIADPLVHLVRNSLDHGIEDAASRRAAGKPEEATLTLRASQEADAVVIEVIDDGGGVDAAAVRRKALERGLVDEDRLREMDDAQAVQMIFLPGFSTADAVSDLSGRGVGMDAVRTAVERLGGAVTLDSRPGEGTTVRLRLPLSMAVSQLMVVGVSGQRFGIAVEQIRELARVPVEGLQRVQGRRAALLRGRTVPLVPLAGVLGMEPPPEGEELDVVVVRPHGVDIGLVVDRVHETLDLIVRPPEGIVAGTSWLAGTALLGDGQVLLVLDVPEVTDNAASAR